MRALLCPASLKGVLSAPAAAAALVRGLGSEATALPVADGGEGTAEIFEAALGGSWNETTVHDPLGRTRTACWLRLPDGRAVVEAASAIGLPLLAPAERDPIIASSRGLGELVTAALSSSPSALVVALGGTATVDGGAGLLEVVRELPVPTLAGETTEGSGFADPGSERRAHRTRNSSLAAICTSVCSEGISAEARNRGMALPRKTGGRSWRICDAFQRKDAKITKRRREIPGSIPSESLRYSLRRALVGSIEAARRPRPNSSKSSSYLFCQLGSPAAKRSVSTPTRRRPRASCFISFIKG